MQPSATPDPARAVPSIPSFKLSSGIFRAPADAAVAVARRERASGGPATKEGKAISAQNATTHGITASCVLMRGETLAERQAGAERLVETFRPQTAGEAEIVARLSDVFARLNRLEAFERLLRETGLEEALKKTPAARKMEAIDTALSAIKGLIETIQSVGAQLVPFEQIQAMTPALQRTLDFVEMADVPMSLLIPFRESLRDLTVESVLGGVGSEEFSSFAATAQDVESWLVVAKKGVEVEQGEERARLAVDPTLADDEAMRRADRYRARIGREIDGLLKLLKQVRELARPQGEEPSSFFHIEVRVVGAHLTQQQT